MYIYIGIILVVVSAIVSLLIGGTGYSFNEIFYALLRQDYNPTLRSIFLDVRIPRILLSLIVGAGLSSTGCVMQGILKNPLAEPYTLGISGGAYLFVSIASFLNLSYLTNSVSACIGAFCFVLIIYFTSRKKSFSITKLLLTGIMLNIISSSVVLFMSSVSEAYKFKSTMNWLSGTLSTNLSMHDLILPYIFILTGIFILIFMSKHIDILSLGEEKAMQLGVDPNKTINILFIVISVITGICVAYSGIIGFIGIMIPHITRRFVSPLHFPLISMASLIGASFLCLADTCSRTILYPVELPVGVITGIVGGIFFIFVLLRQK
jgi:iron complex transport system permease protein